MRFDYPDAIVAIRKKQDVARSLLEKTRGEMTVAMSNRTAQRQARRAAEEVALTGNAS